jgi:hypothetical protein
VSQQLESCQKEQMTTKKKRGGVNDYSRFDQLDDCSDEEPEPEPEKTPPPKPKAKPAKKKSEPKPPPKKPVVESSDEDIDENEILSTKKGSDKKDSKYWWDNRGGANASSTGTISPQKLASADQVNATNVQAGASQWNSAGTWEEKNMEDWFESRLKSALNSIEFEQDGAEASVTSVEGFSGDVNICKRRNKTSWIYDVTFKVKFEIDGHKGTLTIPELSNMDEDDYSIELTWASSAKKRGEVENVLNMRGQRGATGLVPRVRDAIAQVSDDFLQQ